MNQDGVAQRPDVSRQPGLDVLTKPDDAHREDVHQIVEATQDVLHGRGHVTQGPGLAGVHEVGQFVDSRKNVRLCKKKDLMICLTASRRKEIEL